MEFLLPYFSLYFYFSIFCNNERIFDMFISWQIFWNAIKSDVCCIFSQENKQELFVYSIESTNLTKVLFIPGYYLANY